MIELGRGGRVAAEVVSFSANSQSGENTYLVGMAENIFRIIKYFRRG